MIVRDATAADIPGIADALEASGESAAWPGMPGWPYLDHLVSRARVPIAIDGQLVLGMAGSMELGTAGARFLSDLFVRPDRQDGGVGRALFAAAMSGATERCTFSSSDPRARATYIRAGMRPWWPNLYLEIPLGRPGSARGAVAGAGTGAGAGSGGAGAGAAPGAALPGDLALRGDPAFPVGSADVEETARASLAWTGMDRTADYAHYRSLPGAAGWLVREGGAIAGVGWSTAGRTRPVRVLQHLTIAPHADSIGVTMAFIEAVAGDVAVGDAEALILTIPGPHPAVPGLLDRGARIVDSDEFCATDPGLLDPERILPNPGFL